MVHPIPFEKLDFKVAAAEHAHSRKQVALTLQPLHRVLLPIPLFVQIPLTHPLAIPREEHLHIKDMPLKPILRRAPRNGEAHPQADRLTGAKRRRKVNAAVRIGDEAAAVVAVHSQAPALPARQPEPGVRRREVAQRQACVGVGLAGGAAQALDVHFEVDGFGAACHGR